MKTFSQTKRDTVYASALGGPAILGLLLFVVIPFVMSVALTVTNQKLLSPNQTEFVGLQNYSRLLSVTMLVQDAERDATGENVQDDNAPLFRRVRDITRTDPRYDGFRPLTQWTMGTKRYVVLAKDPVFLQSLWNTFLFALIVVPLQCSLALALALLVNAGLKGQTVFRTVYFSPVVMSLVVLSVVWAFLFNAEAGLINQFLRFISFGLIQGPDWLGNARTAMPAISIMSAWQGAGFQMLIFLAGLQGIPEELYDAAKIDGASPWQRFLHVTLPGLSHSITFVIVVTTIAAFGLFTQVDVMTQGGPKDATSTVMFHAIQKGVREQDIAYGATITVIYFVIISVIALVQQRFLTQREAR